MLKISIRLFVERNGNRCKDKRVFGKVQVLAAKQMGRLEGGKEKAKRRRSQGWFGNLGLWMRKMWCRNKTRDCTKRHWFI